MDDPPLYRIRRAAASQTTTLESVAGHDFLRFSLPLSLATESRVVDRAGDPESLRGGEEVSRVWIAMHTDFYYSG